MGKDIISTFINDEKWFTILETVENIKELEKYGDFYVIPEFDRYSVFISNYNETKYSLYEIYDIQTLKGIILGSIWFNANKNLKHLMYHKYLIDINYNSNAECITDLNLTIVFRDLDLLNVVNYYMQNKHDQLNLLYDLPLSDDNILLLLINDYEFTIPEDRYNIISDKFNKLLSSDINAYLVKNLVPIVTSYII